MQAVSALWGELLALPGTAREFRFTVGGTDYGPESEIGHSVEHALFGAFGMGGAEAAKLTLSLFAENIPRGAEIRRFVRLRNGAQASEWLPAGVFHVSRRVRDGEKWTLTAYDAMRRADMEWEPDQALTFPLSMASAAAECARLMGVSLDPRSRLEPSYTMGWPASGTTVRDALRHIAAAHGGNWTVTPAGQLRLVFLEKLPERADYLITQAGEPITFGGVRILV